MNGRTLALASLAGLAIAGAAVQRRREGSFVRQGSRRPVDPVTRSPAFQAWFKQSVVTGARGQPLVVYHGTPDARGLLQEGFSTHADRACWRRDDEGDVFFASASPKVAESYADESRAWDFQGSEPAVIPLYLSIQNPLVVDARGQRWRNTQRQIDVARKLGHDGIIIQNSVDYYDSPPPGTRVPTTTVYAWFSPAQAKSAMKVPLRSRVDGRELEGSGPNRGDWDLMDPVLSANRSSPMNRVGSRAEDRHTKPNATRDVVRGNLVATLSDTLTIRIDHDRTCHAPTALLYDGDVNVGHAQLSRVTGPNDEHLDRYECRDEIRRLAERLQRMGHASVTYWTMWRSELRNTYIGRGLGVDMYEAALTFVHAKFDKPAIIFPELCMEDGTTSAEAERVWGSLGRRWENEGWAVASVPLAHAPGRRTSPWLRPQGSHARGSRDVGTFLDADLPGYLVGWRVMRYDPKRGDAVSGADSRQRVPLVKGVATRLRGIGMFLGSTAAYVQDYYGGNDHNVLMRYAFRRADVTRGNLLDREPEIAVREAILLDWTIFDGEEA